MINVAADIVYSRPTVTTLCPNMVLFVRKASVIALNTVRLHAPLERGINEFIAAFTYAC